MNSVTLSSFMDELEKIKQAGTLGEILRSEAAAHPVEVAGLGMLAALPIDQLQAHLRSAKGEDWQKKSLLGGETGHAVGDVAGLGVLAAPSIAHMLHK